MAVVSEEPIPASPGFERNIEDLPDLLHPVELQLRQQGRRDLVDVPLVPGRSDDRRDPVPLGRERNLDSMNNPVFTELVARIRKHFFTQSALD